MTTDYRNDAKAIRIVVEALWKNGEEYHAGLIDHEAFAQRNRELWDAAEQRGIVQQVRRAVSNPD